MQCKQEQQLEQEAMEQSEHFLANLNTGLSRITTPKKRSIKSNPDSMKEIINTPCRWNEDNKGQPIYRRSFGWHPDVDEPALPNFSETVRTPISKHAGNPKMPNNIAKKRKIEKACTYQTSKKRKRNYLAKGAVQTWQRRATAHCQALKIKLSQPSIPPAMSKTQEAFSILVLQLRYHELQNVMCFGCVAKLAGANPDLPDKFRDQLLITLGAVTANQEAQIGLTDIAETSLSFGTTRMNA